MKSKNIKARTFLLKKIILKNSLIEMIQRFDVKKIYPNKLIINFTPAKPICIILLKDHNIILGDNGKKLDIETVEKNCQKSLVLKILMIYLM